MGLEAVAPCLSDSLASNCSARGLGERYIWLNKGRLRETSSTTTGLLSVSDSLTLAVSTLLAKLAGTGGA